MISVAVPLQRYKQVLGAVMLSTSDREIRDELRRVRLEVLRIFAVTLLVTVLVSLYLASTIARPIRRLAAAAQRARGRGGRIEIPELTGRNDEIGELAGALREMTDALWLRMSAIESFAADVAHEIKNPLSSLRSAVETVARIADPEKQRRLMAIIQEDVERLDRLITDISDASRLDAELGRVEFSPTDIAAMLRTLVEIHETTRAPDAPRLVLELPADQPGRSRPLIVPGIESRLSQVFLNLIANAVSFSPPGGEIRIARAARRPCRSRHGRGPGARHSRGQADRDLRPLLYRAAGRREIRHAFRSRPVDLETDRRGASRPDLGREPARRAGLGRRRALPDPPAGTSHEREPPAACDRCRDRRAGGAAARPVGFRKIRSGAAAD